MSSVPTCWSVASQCERRGVKWSSQHELPNSNPRSTCRSYPRFTAPRGPTTSDGHASWPVDHLNANVVDLLLQASIFGRGIANASAPIVLGCPQAVLQPFGKAVAPE